jgi:U3 small nucleolar RNA-associated protein 22
MIFRPQLDVYDIIIHLKHEQITNSIEAIDFPAKYKFNVQPFNKEISDNMPIVGFDPIIIYLDKLRNGYSNFALFFYDTFGGKEIGVILKPYVFEIHSFKISHINCSLLSSTANDDGKPLILTNVESLVEDFKILGQGIVDFIETRSENWEKIK